MLQEIEQSFALAALLREQITILEEHGLSKLDPDLYSNDLKSKISIYSKKNNFKAKITKAVGEWPTEEDIIVTAIKKRHFQYLDSRGISNFQDIFHLCRERRNYLAHEFFLEHSTDKTTPEGVAKMERELENMLIDFHFIQYLASSLVTGFYQGLNTYVKHLIDEHKDTE